MQFAAKISISFFKTYLKLKAIFAVMNTTVVVKIRPEKIQACLASFLRRSLSMSFPKQQFTYDLHIFTVVINPLVVSMNEIFSKRCLDGLSYHNKWKVISLHGNSIGHIHIDGFEITWLLLLGEI